MKLTLEPGERPILTTRLGLATTATDAVIGEAVARRLVGTDAPPPAASAPAGLPAVAYSTDPLAETTIAQAVRDGKFPAERADHYRQSWARDPVATRRVIARLHKCDPALIAAGSGPAGSDAYPASWLRAQDGSLTRRSRVHGD